MSKVTDKIDEKTNELKEYSTGTVSKPIGGYDPNKDYMASMLQKIKNGDFPGAAEDERLRNMKIADTGSTYSPTNWFNYQDGTQYARENLLGEIKDYNKKGFSYNPDEDAVYQSLDQMYKQQALDNYNDNITSLARQYGGEIPAYLRQIAKNSYQAEAGKANDAIPTLSQMAWDMWADTRNDMYDQYVLLDAQESKDYNKFVDNRNFVTGAADNLYGRSVTERQMENTDKELALNEMYKKGATLWEMKSYYRSLGFSDAESDRMAKEAYVNYYGGFIPEAVSSSTVSANKPSGGTAPGKGGSVVPATAKVVEDDDDYAPGDLYVDEEGNIKMK